MRGCKSLLLLLVCIITVFLVTGCKFENVKNDPEPQNNIITEPEQHETPTNTPTPSPEPTAAPTPVPEKKNVKVKGLYLTGWSAGNKERMEKYIKLVEETELNAFVIDIKNDDGIVSYNLRYLPLWKRVHTSRSMMPKSL